MSSIFCILNNIRGEHYGTVPSWLVDHKPVLRLEKVK